MKSISIGTIAMKNDNEHESILDHKSINNINNGNTNGRSRKLSYLNDKFCVFFVVCLKYAKCCLIQI